MKAKLGLKRTLIVIDACFSTALHINEIKSILEKYEEDITHICLLNDSDPKVHIYNLNENVKLYLNTTYFRGGGFHAPEKLEEISQTKSIIDKYSEVIFITDYNFDEVEEYNWKCKFTLHILESCKAEQLDIIEI